MGTKSIRHIVESTLATYLSTQYRRHAGKMSGEAT